MKNYCSLIGAIAGLAVGTVHAAPWEPGLVARIHFAGSDAVTADRNSSLLRNLCSTSEALALRTQTLDKLSHFLDDWLGREIAPALPMPLQTRSLLADLCQAEWQLEVRQPSGGAAEFSLAVRLNNARAQAWQTALNPVVTSWQQSSPAHHGSLIRQGEWLCFALDNAYAPTPAGAIAGLNHAWLAADVDWGRLAVWFPAVAKFDVPQTHLQVAGADRNIDVTGRLFLSQSLPSIGPWQFPTNVVHSPFISFTAARGISDWLRQQPWAVSLGINPLPDQVYTWVLPQIPFLAYAAMPAVNARAVLPKVAGALTGWLRDQPTNSSYQRIYVDSTNDQIAVIGFPFMAPYLQARQEAGGPFLVSGFLPVIPRGKPAPPELFARLNEPNLVFYHWEITAERLKIFPQLYQLAFLVTGHRQLEGGTAADNWLKHLGPTLGPTVTTATEVSPTELSFSRKAPAGLTALELIALASWLEAPDFPGCDLRMPPPRKHPRRHPAPGAVAPPGQHP